MAQEFLDRPQVSPGVQEMGGEAVSQCMYLEPRALAQDTQEPLYHQLHPAWGKASAPLR